MRSRAVSRRPRRLRCPPGRQQGPVFVAAGGRVDVEPQGTLAGSLDVDGVLRNRGIRGGAVSGAGVVDDLPGATVKRTVVRNGTTDIEW